MCDKCDELDKKMERYRIISARITDEKTIEGLKALIKGLRKRRALLLMSLTASKKRKPGALEPNTKKLGKLATSMRLSAPTSSRDCPISPSTNRTSGGRLS